MTKAKGDKPTRTQEGVDVAYSSPTAAALAEASAKAQASFEEKHATVGDLDIPLNDEGKYLIGRWGPHGNYGCPYRAFDTLEGDAVIENHIHLAHPTQWLADFDVDAAAIPKLDQPPAVGPAAREVVSG